jgi:hypothetical protein
MGFHEIGSDFWQINIENRESQQLWWEDSQYQRSYFKSGRNAIKALCQLLSKTGKKALLAIYTCKTVIQPFLEEGWSVRFYQIHKDMSVNMENLLDMVNAFQPTVVYLQSYFGFDTLNFGADFIAEMHNKNIVVVEDITQSLFSEHFVKGADYYVTSFRKFFAVPDGGGLFSKNGCTELDCMSADSEITRIAFEAFDKKREYMKNPSVEKKQEFRQLYALLNNRLSDNSVVRKMSQDSLDILEKCNKDIIRKKRSVVSSQLLHLHHSPRQKQRLDSSDHRL